MSNIQFPVYPNDKGYIDIPDGYYLCKKFPEYKKPLEEVVSIARNYLTTHYECVLDYAKGELND